MAYLVRRGNVWWYRIKEAGKWIDKPTEFRVLDADGKIDPSAKRSAQRLAKRHQDRIAAAPGGKVTLGPVTVRVREGLDRETPGRGSRLEERRVPAPSPRIAGDR